MHAIETFDSLPSRSQGYGLTETNSAVTAISGPDYVLRPKSMYVPFYFSLPIHRADLLPFDESRGVPGPVNDAVIVKDGVVVPPGTVGELWM